MHTLVNDYFVITCLKAFRGNMTLVDIIYCYSIEAKAPITIRITDAVSKIRIASETVGHRLKNFKLAVTNYLFSRILSTANLAF